MIYTKAYYLVINPEPSESTAKKDSQLILITFKYLNQLPALFGLEYIKCFRNYRLKPEKCSTKDFFFFCPHIANTLGIFVIILGNFALSSSDPGAHALSHCTQLGDASSNLACEIMHFLFSVSSSVFYTSSHPPEGLQYRSETGVDPEHQGGDSGENDPPEGGAKGAHTPTQNPSQAAQHQQEVFQLIHLLSFIPCSDSSLFCIKKINTSVLPKCTTQMPFLLGVL